MKYIFITLLAWGLTGCGAVYFSPQVQEDDPSVTVIDINPQSLTQANASGYKPKSLPAVFFQTAAAGGDILPGAGALPAPVVNEQTRPQAARLRLPPKLPQLPYTIGVGDVILLATPSAGNTVEQLSGLLAAQNRRQGYTVQDDGSIAIPDVGRVSVAGLTLEQAEDEVFKRLVENQFDPTFSIEISNFNSQRVSIGGAVAQPTIVPITLTGLTLEQVIAGAGGIAAKEAKFASIRLYRSGELYEIPLEQYLNRQTIQKTRLADGDSIFVDTSFEIEKAQAYFTQQITLVQARGAARAQALAELNAATSLRQSRLEEKRQNFQARLAADAVDRDFVYLTGEVNQPSRYPLPFGRKATLADALFDSGGFSNDTGNPTQIYVLRAQNDDAPVAAWRLDARNAGNLVLATRFELRPNDIVFIAEQPVTRWNRVVAQIRPSLISTGVAAVK